MGCSYSDDAPSKKKNLAFKSPVDKYVKSLHSFHRNQAEKFQRIQNWKQVLLDIFRVENPENSETWKKIQTVLESYLEETDEEKNVQWIINAQFATYTSPVYCSQFLSREEPNVLDLDKLSEEKHAKALSSTFGNLSELEQPMLLKAYGRKVSDKSTSISPFSVKAWEKSQIFLSFQSKVSAKQELRRNLLLQLEHPNHIVFALIKTFVSALRKMFKYILKEAEVSDGSNSSNYDGIFNDVLAVSKRFIQNIKIFVMWIYEDLLLQLENGLDQEDLNAEYVIESVICGLLFQKSNSFLKRLVFALLEWKYKDDIQAVSNAIQEKQTDPLEAYDEVLKRSRSFLLESSSCPYLEVISKLKVVKTESSPYRKFEILSTLEEEMFNAVYNMHKDDPILMLKLKESMSMDIRIPLMIYSIVQSNCPNLVIERLFVEEFTHSQTLEASLPFTNFKSSIDFLLNPGRTSMEVSFGKKP